MRKRSERNELIASIVFTLFMIVLMELGRQIALPAIDPELSKKSLNASPLLRNISMLTGGQYRFPSLFSIGLGPYMTSMILFQAIQMVNSSMMEKISEQKKGYIQRWITLGIAILQTMQFIFASRSQISPSEFKIMGFDFNVVVSFVVLLAGAMVVAWMSDMTAKYGIGGAGVLIMPGIITSLPAMVLHGPGLGTYQIKSFSTNLWIALGVSVLVVFVATIFFNKAELRIPLQRPAVQNDFSESYLPIRFLTSGSMPFMFTTTVFMIPSYIASLNPDSNFGKFTQTYVNFNNPIGILIYCCVVVFLGYAFSFMNLQTERQAENLKKSGDYIFGITPGKDTQRYLNSHAIKLSTAANVYFLVIVATPLIIGLYVPGVTNFTFAYASILILVTIMDTTLDQVKTMYLRTQYDLL